MKTSNTDPGEELAARVLALEEAVSDLDRRVIDVTLRMMVVEEAGPDD